MTEGEDFDGSERCQDCDDLGDWQCPTHGAETIALQRAIHEGAEVRAALDTLLLCPTGTRRTRADILTHHESATP